MFSSAVICTAALFFISPLVQDESYHNFCDSKMVLNVPNFWNVVSNLPFLIVGILGVFKTCKFQNSKIQYLLFFLGISFVSIGSGYYHWSPSNSTLVWDRLPMTIAFMSLFSIIISEFINDTLGKKLLFPTVLIGLFSVIYWQFFDDLRIYVLVQFYPMIAIPVILLFFTSKYNLTYGYWVLSAAYFIAKIFEYFDHEMDVWFNGISGHPLKHITAALGIFFLLFTYLRREEHITK